jgi:hypothetical protein
MCLMQVTTYSAADSVSSTGFFEVNNSPKLNCCRSVWIFFSNSDMIASLFSILATLCTCICICCWIFCCCFWATFSILVSFFSVSWKKEQRTDLEQISLSLSSSHSQDKPHNNNKSMYKVSNKSLIDTILLLTFFRFNDFLLRNGTEIKRLIKFARC